MEETRHRHCMLRAVLGNYRFDKFPNGLPNKLPWPKTTELPGTEALHDGYIRKADLVSGRLEERLLSELFDDFDTYKPLDLDTKSQSDIEKQLSLLNQEASKIILKVHKDFAAGQSSTELCNKDKDTLHRHLFIEHFRNRTFHRFAENATQHNFASRESFIAFMKKENITQPFEVTYRSLQAMLNAGIRDISSEGFEPEIARIATRFRAYPRDIDYFIKGMIMYQLAFLQPNSAQMEFLLLENACSILEKPCDSEAWLDTHIFSPLAPRLLVVLRSNTLNPRIVNDSHLRAMQNQFRVSGLGTLRSLLEDLPVQPPVNRYSEVIHSRGETSPTNFVPENPVLTFTFFKLSDRHMNLINAIILDNIPLRSRIIYCDPMSFRSSLEYYFDMSLTGFKAVKTVPIRENYIIPKQSIMFPSKPRKYYGSLEEVARELGSMVTMKYLKLERYGLVIRPIFTPETERRYLHLGGIFENLLLDWDEAKRMARYWIMIDTSIVLEPLIEQKRSLRNARENRLGGIGLHKIWLMTKNLKESCAITLDVFDDFRSTGLNISGVEDTLADEIHLFDARTIGVIMMRAAFFERFLKSGFVNWENAKTYLQCGSIRYCGIQAIEDYAHQLNLTMTPSVDQQNNSPFSSDGLREMLVRAEVAKHFKTLSCYERANNAQALYKALFESCFPLYKQDVDSLRVKD